MYKIEEINPGDEVIFYSTNQQSNYDLYWIVRGTDKERGKIMIETPSLIPDTKYWTLDLNEVKGHIALSKMK